MGIHFGVVAAKTSWSRFFSALCEVTGDFLDRGSVTSIEGCDLEGTEAGFPVVGGEYQGSAFLLDNWSVLAAGDFDRLVNLSGKLGCIIAACTGETVSGTFGLFVAEKGKLRRLYWNCISTLRQSFQMGEPLPTESTTSLEDIDGKGLFGALGYLELDYNGWYDSGSKRLYLYTHMEPSAPSPHDKGPIMAALEEHRQRFEVPQAHVRKPKVVSRRLPDGSVGFDIVTGPPRKGIIDRIRSFFRRQ